MKKWFNKKAHPIIVGWAIFSEEQLSGSPDNTQYQSNDGDDQ